MFKSDRVTILEWMLIIGFMALPFVNLAFILWIFMRRGSSQTVKNLVIAFGIFIIFALIALAIWGF
jgi:heme/copper-type cytochrome/quinol oxidase subunit 4